MLQLALKHEIEQDSHFVVKKATEFTQEIDLDLETDFNRDMKNMENALKLKRIATEKGKKAINNVW